MATQKKFIEFEKLDGFGGIKISKLITTPNGNTIRGIAGHARTMMLTKVGGKDGFTVVVTPDSGTVTKFGLGDAIALFELGLKIYDALKGAGSGGAGGDADCGDIEFHGKAKLKSGRKVTITASCGAA